MRNLLKGCGLIIGVMFVCGAFALLLPTPEVEQEEIKRDDQPLVEDTLIQEGETADSIQTEIIKTTAEQLYGAYLENELKAGKDYEGRIVEVSGVVRSIGEDILGTPYVTLKGDVYFGDVQCFLNNSVVDSAMELKEGDSVTFTGKVSGYLMNVLIRDCK
jgi:molybdopterin converting factor small subunit